MANVIQAYQNFANKRIKLTDINEQFQENFTKYLIEYRELTHNTVARLFKQIKTFMKWAERNGYHNNHHFKEIKQPEKPGDIIVLNWHELMALFELQVTKEVDQVVRDGFLLQCFTSLRYSDLKNLKKSDVKGDYLDITAIKTRDLNRIPLNQYSRTLIERYWHSDTNYIIPVISNQKFNKKIKTICRWAGMKEPITLVKYRGQERIETILPKYRAISSHVGRKTFITNALTLGMPTETVMAISNHKDYKTFKRYINIADEEKKKAMDKAFS